MGTIDSDADFERLLDAFPGARKAMQRKVDSALAEQNRNVKELHLAVEHLADNFPRWAAAGLIPSHAAAACQGATLGPVLKAAASAGGLAR